MTMPRIHTSRHTLYIRDTTLLKNVDCSHLHLIRWHFFCLFQSYSQRVMVWCWLITLWMRYVFRIRNFSYTIYAKCLPEQNRTQCEHSFVHSLVRSFALQSAEWESTHSSSEYDRMANAKINQFNWKWCVLYFRFSYVLIVCVWEKNWLSPQSHTYNSLSASVAHSRALSFCARSAFHVVDFVVV